MSHLKNSKEHYHRRRRYDDDDSDDDTAYLPVHAGITAYYPLGVNVRVTTSDPIPILPNAVVGHYAFATPAVPVVVHQNVVYQTDHTECQCPRYVDATGYEIYYGPCTCGCNRNCSTNSVQQRSSVQQTPLVAAVVKTNGVKPKIQPRNGTDPFVRDVYGNIIGTK